MRVAIVTGDASLLAEYATVPIAFEVRARLMAEPVAEGLEGIQLREEPVEPAYIKDYDGSAEGGPERWAKRFDLRNWGFLLAREGDEAVGGAALAHDTPGLDMLDGRSDLTVLWDIRVAPAARRRGIGRALFARGVAWARARGCRQLKVETQNINVPACRFYVRQGCRLGAIHRHAYVHEPEIAHEVMLLWYLDLANQ